VLIGCKSASFTSSAAMTARIKAMEVSVELPFGVRTFGTEQDLNEYIATYVRMVETIAKYRSVDLDYLREWSEKALADFRAGKMKIEEAREISGCEALYREADDHQERADELEDRLWETQATSLPGVLGQIALLREWIHYPSLDAIIAGIKALVPKES
jgi:hypothetical protein